MRTCSRCRTAKDPADFYRNRSRRDGLMPWCKACVAEANDSDEARQRGRRNKLLSRFGITQAEYDGMLAAQGGRCAACGNVETAMGNHGDVKALAVDHDHQTGAVRGLLCQGCNITLGVLGDDPDRLVALAAYAIKARELIPPPV